MPSGQPGLLPMNGGAAGVQFAFPATNFCVTSDAIDGLKNWHNVHEVKSENEQPEASCPDNSHALLAEPTVDQQDCSNEDNVSKILQQILSYDKYNLLNKPATVAPEDEGLLADHTRLGLQLTISQLIKECSHASTAHVKAQFQSMCMARLLAYPISRARKYACSISQLLDYGVKLFHEFEQKEPAGAAMGRPLQPSQQPGHPIVPTLLGSRGPQDAHNAVGTTPSVAALKRETRGLLAGVLATAAHKEVGDPLWQGQPFLIPPNELDDLLSLRVDRPLDVLAPPGHQRLRSPHGAGTPRRGPSYEWGEVDGTRVRKRKIVLDFEEFDDDEFDDGKLQRHRPPDGGSRPLLSPPSGRGRGRGRSRGRGRGRASASVSESGMLDVCSAEDVLNGNMAAGMWDWRSHGVSEGNGLTMGSARSAGSAGAGASQGEKGKRGSILSDKLQLKISKLLERVLLRPEEDAEDGDKRYDVAWDRIRESEAAAFCRTSMKINFRPILHKLVAGQYTTFDNIAADVEAAMDHAAEDFDYAAFDIRKTKVSSSAKGFAQLIADELFKIETQNAKREKRKGYTWVVSKEQEVEEAYQQQEAAKDLPASIKANQEAFFHVDVWRKEPYLARPYVRLSAYEFVEDEADLQWKLETSKHGGCDGQGCLKHDDLGRFNLERLAFVGKCPCLSNNTECDGRCQCTREQCLNRAIGLRKICVLGEDIDEIDTWGVDCYTRRNIHDAALESQAFGPFTGHSDGHERGRGSNYTPAVTQAPGNGDHVASPTIGKGHLRSVSQDGTQDVRDKVAHWVERTLLPALLSLGTEGWDLAKGCQKVEEQAEAEGNVASKVAAQAVRVRLEQVGYNYFRVHPKGKGLQCIRPGGLPPLTLLDEYFGELHTPWRWFEVQDAVKKLTKDELPEFYNMTLERPKDDEKGYDCLFIEAAHKASFCSRMSHSCTPNCQAVVMAASGRLTVAMYTTRHVELGEELTFDYSAVTESEKEFRAATCLCGTRGCRGSFLMYTGSAAFNEVLSTDHHMLQRQALLLAAGTWEVTDEDGKLLARHGVKQSALGSQELGTRVPSWLVKWTALILLYIEREQQLLPAKLRQLKPPYTPLGAEIEAQGVAMNRLSNVVVTLDKIKYCLRHADCNEPPLREVEQSVVLEYLWTGDKSVAKRLLLAAGTALADAQVARALGQAGDGEQLREVVASTEEEYPQLQRIAEQVLGDAETVQEARDKLRALSMELRELAIECAASGSKTVAMQHVAAADVLLLYSATQTWFVPERNYKGFQSPPVSLNFEQLNLDRTGAGEAKGAVAEISSKKKFRGFATATSTDGNPLCKKYGPLFIWGQLNGWYKQTVNDPAASLSAERRGTICLPVIESCYGKHGKQGYCLKDRTALLDHLSKKPYWQWPTRWIFSFNNQAKMYGSPWFDTVWNKLNGEGSDPMPALLEELQSATLPT